MNNSIESLLQLQDKGPKVTEFISRGKLITSTDILYVPRMLAKLAFPHRDPKKHTFLSRNGTEVLHLETGYEITKNRKDSKPLGIPYGIIPRLIFVFIATEVRLTGKKEIELSSSVSSFLKEIGYQVSGGEKGSLTSLYDQLKRIVNCRVWHITYEDRFSNTKKTKSNLGPIDEISLWESYKGDDEMDNGGLRVKLHQKFYEDILDHSFPVKKEGIEYLRPSVLAVDLYFFLCQRLGYLEARTPISFEDLHDQLGANYKKHTEFGRKARKYIRKINHIYPEMNYSFGPGTLFLYKSPTHVKEKSTN